MQLYTSPPRVQVESAGPGEMNEKRKQKIDNLDTYTLFPFHIPTGALESHSPSDPIIPFGTFFNSISITFFTSSNDISPEAFTNMLSSSCPSTDGRWLIAFATGPDVAVNMEREAVVGFRARYSSRGSIETRRWRNSRSRSRRAVVKTRWDERRRGEYGQREKG